MDTLLGQPVTARLEPETLQPAGHVGLFGMGGANRIVDQAAEQASIDRAALGRALIELGFLSIRRRRITPRIQKRKADRISCGARRA